MAAAWTPVWFFFNVSDVVPLRILDQMVCWDYRHQNQWWKSLQRHGQAPAWGSWRIRSFTRFTQDDIISYNHIDIAWQHWLLGISGRCWTTLKTHAVVLAACPPKADLADAAVPNSETPVLRNVWSHFLDQQPKRREVYEGWGRRNRRAAYGNQGDTAEGLCWKFSSFKELGTSRIQHDIEILPHDTWK